ncbi:DNA mismatch endonuclease Vsr [candidate division KSB1 bacterium]|nr:DNA mismatch endonuclease Vsr [candidate division KSB1 bacterium]
MDIWTKDKRSEVMSRIRSKDTKPEKLVRSLLHSMGYRFRINVKNLIGKPDIVLKKYNAIIFVHGCFWHLHKDCKEGRIPGTRTEYWAKKLLKNKERDQRHMQELTDLGWRVLRVWECEIERHTEETMDKIREFLEEQ